LSALGIFPEIAIPTSLVWTFGHVNTSSKVGLESKVLWDDRYLAENVDWVVENFDAGVSYIHPVKLGLYTGDNYLRLIERLK
jgi:hypothetical protein